MSSSREDEEEVKMPLDGSRGRQQERGRTQVLRDDIQIREISESQKIKADYTERGLDLCHYCGLKFNVGERIPRIIVGCGHTFCTSCLSYFLRNQRIRCPMCRKLLKHCESVDKLPLNFNILYEVVTKDPLLSRVNFEKCLQADPDLYHDDEAYERDFAPYMCQKHEQRIKHFYCSEHPSIFCRECIADLHNLEACFVVDLYEIEKMRKLQQQNNEANKRQLGRRQDGSTHSYVIHPQSEAKKAGPLQIADTQERRPRHEAVPRHPTVQDPTMAKTGANFFHKPQRYPNQQANGQVTGGPIVEFDSNQFDGQGVSSQDQILAAQHHQMLMNAGQKSFPNQPFGYGLKGPEAQGETSFSEDEDENREDEDDSFNSDLEDGDLNSAQKQKLKRDLLMMGYGRNGEFEEDNDEDLAGEVAAAQALLAAGGSSAQDAAQLQQIQYLQQKQFEEAMRIQMAMKQMPLDGAEMQLAQSMGLRVKNPPNTGEEIALAAHEQILVESEEQDSPSEDDPLQQQKQFEMDKKLFAQQMKEELLGKSKPAKITTPKEEVKVAPANLETIQKEESPKQQEQPPTDGEQKKSFNSEVEKVDTEQGKGSKGSSAEQLIESPVVASKQASAESGDLAESAATTDPTTQAAASEGRKSLTERSQNNDGSENQNESESAVEQPMKENTAPADEVAPATQ